MSNPEPAPVCPLCDTADVYGLPGHDGAYRRCRQCRLVFLDPSRHLEPADEKAIYDLHENEVDDEGYRAFLSRTTREVCRQLPPPAEGLDFGCGPGPALIAMMRENGYRMYAYDLYYCNDPSVFDRRYDFITCTEVAEHLRHPGVEFERLWGLLRPGGLLVVQTKRAVTDALFSQWFYRRDPTHIVFYAEQTFAWLAEHCDAELEFSGADVACLRRKQDA